MRLIIACILSMITFFSTTGFVVNRHYCQKELKSQSLWLPAKNCHSLQMTGCKMHPPTSEKSKKDCCSSDADVVLDDTDKVFQGAPDVTTFQPAMAIMISLLEWEVNEDYSSEAHYQNYKPPLIETDLSVRHQVFRL